MGNSTGKSAVGLGTGKGCWGGGGAERGEGQLVSKMTMPSL